jgi:hypothetical protein
MVKKSNLDGDNGCKKRMETKMFELGKQKPLKKNQKRTIMIIWTQGIPQTINIVCETNSTCSIYYSNKRFNKYSNTFLDLLSLLFKCHYIL